MGVNQSIQNGKNVCYLLINDNTCISEIVMLTRTSQNKNTTYTFRGGNLFISYYGNDSVQSDLSITD